MFADVDSQQGIVFRHHRAREPRAAKQASCVRINKTVSEPEDHRRTTGLPIASSADPAGAEATSHRSSA
jgi:hypothetical protein